MNHKSLIATFFLIANYPLIHSSEHGPIDARSGSAKSPRLRTAAEIEDDRRHLDYDNSSSCNLPPATQPSPIRKPATKRSFAAIDADHPETPCSLVDSTLSESSDTDVATMTAPAVAPHASHLPHGHDCVLCVIG
ncbi:MAG TPA: hypothetical protein VJJ83_01080, partial [Candidatus Babeliales bacterium]|nr:hypothetical protein [Candidatus Babeliales bacterium]